MITTAMCFALGSIALLVIGGLSGVYTGIIPVDWQVHNTSFVVAHIHYVLIGANVFPVFAGLYYWLPKMTGRMMNETLGKWSFWIMFIGFNVGFFPMHLLGLAGMPRRIYTYPASAGFGPMNLVVTIGAFVLGLGILVSIINFAVSRKTGKIAGRNPWNADTLEWATDSPPAPYAVVHIPTVITRHPLWDNHDEDADPDNVRLLDHGRLTFATTWLDSEPYTISRMPSETLAPVLLALSLFLLAISLVFQLLWPALAGMILTIACCCFWLWPRNVKDLTV